MATTIEGCLKWIDNERTTLESCEYGRNKKAVNEKLSSHRAKNTEISNYKTQVDRCKPKDDVQNPSVETLYNNLQNISDKRLDCLEMMGKVAAMESSFATICSEVAEKATNLTKEIKSKKRGDTPKYHASIANSSQGSILANRDIWSWLMKLVKCSEIQLTHAAEYQQFYHELSEYEQWMPAELFKADELLSSKDLKKNSQGEETLRLLREIKTALTMFLHWKLKVDSVFEKSRRIVPVNLRTQKLDHDRPAVLLANYKTEQIHLQDDEEVTLVDNSKKDLWKVKNLRGQEAEVPSTILVIPGPDAEAVEAAMRLCFQYLSIWMNTVKRVGCSIILFLLTIIRDWTDEEEKMLRALSKSDKQDILALFESIVKTFSPFWDKYPPYQLLQQRMERTKKLLAMDPDPNFKGSKEGKILIIQTGLLEDLLAKFREFWSQWEKYKILLETSRHPEFVLLAKDWKDLQFVSASDWLVKWKEMYGIDMDWESLGKSENGLGSDEVDDNMSADEKYMLKRAKETAVSSHMTTSEQEESQTFVITGVIDPRSGEEISLDKAIEEKIINQSTGTYVNPITKESMPIPSAMSAGHIKVEFTKVKKSEEKKTEIGLITINMYRESRPYTIKGVIDASTEKKLSVDAAVKAGILDQKRNIYKNKHTHEELSLADALDSGLLEVEFDNASDLKANEPEIQTKTYAVTAVYDLKAKKRMTYQQAIDKGIVNEETGSYFNTYTGEQVYVGEAIKKGHIKATVVKDVSLLDFDIGHKIVMTETLDNFKQKLLKPLQAMNAFKSLANGSVNGSN